MEDYLGYEQQMVVAHYKDGSLVKGYTEDFSPLIETFTIIAPQDTNDLTEINTSDLKALFFVKTFEGNSEYLEKSRFEDIDNSQLKGFRVKIAFPDGEVIRGMISDYRNIFKGFYLRPVDPNSNNERIYVEVNPSLEISIGSMAEK
jgi:hypothetical protein